MSQDKAKIWFFTDIHGSTVCFKKFLNLVENPNRPNVLIIGGDITGKQLIPIIENENSTYSIPIGGQDVIVKKNAISSLIQSLSDIGYYPYQCSLIEYKNIKFSDEKYREVFDKLIKERLLEWIKIADAKLPSKDICQVIVNAGNDDPFFVDSILDSSTKLIRAEGKVIDMPVGLKLLSTGYSTKTPWDCPRDITEDELTKIIGSMTQQLDKGKESRLIFNFHCPPIDSSLDLAHKIDTQTLRPKAGLGSNPTINVGSRSVRNAIEFWQPIVSLHGHIHEVHAKEYIKSTLCFNPGTDYQHGKLQGAFIQINENGVIEYESLTKELHNPIQQVEGENIIKTILASLPLIGNFYKNYNSQKDVKSNLKIDKIERDIESIKNLLSNFQDPKEKKEKE